MTKEVDWDGLDVHLPQRFMVAARDALNKAIAAHEEHAVIRINPLYTHMALQALYEITDIPKNEKVFIRVDPEHFDEIARRMHFGQAHRANGHLMIELPWHSVYAAFFNFDPREGSFDEGSFADGARAMRGAIQTAIYDRVQRGDPPLSVFRVSAVPLPVASPSSSGPSKSEKRNAYWQRMCVEIDMAYSKFRTDADRAALTERLDQIAAALRFELA